MTANVNKKDICAGVLFALTGALYGLNAYANLPMGQAWDMGPGYFPMVLSGLLIILGLATVGRSFYVAAERPFGAVPWRAIVMLTLATLTFATLVGQLGMLFGVWLTSTVASLASPQIKLRSAVLVGFCLSLFCVLVFSFGIKIPIPVFGSWLRFGA